MGFISTIPGTYLIRRSAGHRHARGNRLMVEIRRFAVVGLINTIFDLTVLNILIVLTHMGRDGIWFALFKAISFLVALLNSYFINQGWTFGGSAAKRSVSQAGQFLLMSLFGAVINVTSASYVATFISPVHGTERYWPSFAALAGTAFAFIFNFVGYKHIVFSPRPLFASINDCHECAAPIKEPSPPIAINAEVGRLDENPRARTFPNTEAS